MSAQPATQTVEDLLDVDRAGVDVDMTEDWGPVMGRTANAILLMGEMVGLSPSALRDQMLEIESRQREANRGAISARGIAMVVVASAVAAILINVILIPFVDDLAGQNTSNLTGNQNTMVSLLPTVILLVPVLVLIFAALAEAR